MSSLNTSQMHMYSINKTNVQYMKVPHSDIYPMYSFFSWKDLTGGHFILDLLCLTPSIIFNPAWTNSNYYLLRFLQSCRVKMAQL